MRRSIRTSVRAELVAAVIAASACAAGVARAQPVAAAVREPVLRGDSDAALAAIAALSDEERAAAEIAYLEARLLDARHDPTAIDRYAAALAAGVPRGVERDLRRRH